MDLTNPNFEFERKGKAPGSAETARQAKLDVEAARLVQAAHPLNCSAWRRLATDYPRLSKKSFKLRLAALSLIDQHQFWSEVVELYPTQADRADAAMDVIVKSIEQIEKQVPGAGWLNDAKGVPAARGGAWPPGAKPAHWQDRNARDGRRMMRGRGEVRLYPSAYVGSRGFTYEIELQALYGNRRTQHLLPDDGYRGGILTIYDFHPSLRRQFRKNGNRKHGISNTVNQPDYDGIGD